MKQFVAGFVVASLLGVGALYAQSNGIINVFDPEPFEETSETAEDLLEEDDNKRKKKGKRRRRRGKLRRKRPKKQRQARRENQPSAPKYDTGSGTSGDSLGGPGRREVSLGSKGGERQLSRQTIERGIDTVWRGIERCLILVPSSAPAAGKVVVGMHITSSGRVTKANLRGPNVIIKGEPGTCIRKKVKSISYPSFDGPDMVVNYPMFFD